MGRFLMCCAALGSLVAASGCEEPCKKGYFRSGRDCKRVPDAGGKEIVDAAVDGSTRESPDSASLDGAKLDSAVGVDAGASCGQGLRTNALGVCEVDIDECAEGLDDCDHSPQACINRVPANGKLFECSCPPGYDGQGVGGDGCVDIDECQASPCDALVTCSNAEGGYGCGNCPTGYQPDAQGQCVDIDECQTNNGGCNVTFTTCQNHAGKAVTCVDLDECIQNAARCGHGGSCKNVGDGGGYACSGCGTGFSSSGGEQPACVDTDECSLNPGRCGNGGTCTNVGNGGGYTCSGCASGYQSSGGTFPTCVDINECATNNGGCGEAARAQCTNTTAGAPICACKRGYGGGQCASCTAGFSASGATCLETAPPTKLFKVPPTGQRACVYFDGAAWAWDAGCSRTYTIGSVTHPFGQDAHHHGNRTFSVIDQGLSVFNESTGLVWHRCAKGQTYSNGSCSGEADYNTSHADAVSYCSSLTDAERTWRLPTARELLMVASFGTDDQGWPIAYFPNRPAPGHYWSATRAADGSQLPFFLYGNSLYVREAGSSMARCASGADLPAPSFLDESNGTVTDRTTRLMWTKCPLRSLNQDQGAADESATCANTAHWKWAAALGACEQLVFAGFSDWRAPNVAELASILDYSRAAPAMKVEAFPPAYDEWTSTISPQQRADIPMHVKTPTNGAVVGNAANNQLLAIRCVR